MQKIIMWVVIVGVLAVGGYFALNPKNADEGAVVPEETTETMTEEKKMAFGEFVKGGGAYKCTVAQHVGDVTSNGTVYINDQMLRGEFNSAVNGLNVDSNMIVRDGYTYTWSSMTPNMGFKIKVAENTAGDVGASASASYAWNSETIGDYDCEPWSIDASLFTVPANITFQEMGAE